VAIVLGFLTAIPVESRLSGTPGAHQLSATDSDYGVDLSHMSNPEIDAWHEAEKNKIEDECNGLMRQLTAEKRQKLQDIVDAARRQVDQERQKIKDAEAEAEDELKDLEKAKKELKVRKPRMGPSRDLIAEQERLIAELEKKIAEKKACIDELRKAEQDLLDAKRKLIEAQKMVEEAQAKHESQKEEVDKEEADIAPAQQDLDYAKEELERVKGIHKAAAARLKSARNDLSEHDAEGLYGSKYTSMDLDYAETKSKVLDDDEVKLSADRAVPEPSAPTKSGAPQPAGITTTAIALLLAALYA
jgi:DNA repair exonuclease SbcCD ATPase subunit